MYDSRFGAISTAYVFFAKIHLALALGALIRHSWSFRYAAVKMGVEREARRVSITDTVAVIRLVGGDVPGPTSSQPFALACTPVTSSGGRSTGGRTAEEAENVVREEKGEEEAP